MLPIGQRKPRLSRRAVGSRMVLLKCPTTGRGLLARKKCKLEQDCFHTSLLNPHARPVALGVRCALTTGTSGASGLCSMLRGKGWKRGISTNSCLFPLSSAGRCPHTRTHLGGRGLVSISIPSRKELGQGEGGVVVVEFREKAVSGESCGTDTE